MKNFILFLTFVSSALTCYSQSEVPLCHLGKNMSVTSVGGRGATMRTTACGFTNNERAYREIEKIMNLAGLPMDFNICKTDSINNAYAAMDSTGARLIVYDEAFLKKLDSDSSRMETVTALAHEIGHHLSGHTLALSDQAFRDSSIKYCNTESENFNKKKCDELRTNWLKGRREQELEADRFAGFIMFKYGATLPQVSSLYYKITSNYNDTLSDHPNLNKRLAAVNAGYELAALYKEAKITYVELEKIKGRRIDFDISDLSTINRNILIEKVTNCIREAASYVAGNTHGQQISVGSGGAYINVEQMTKYIGKSEGYWPVDGPTEYFMPVNEFIELTYDSRVKFSPQPTIHIKDGFLTILVFGVQAKPKVVYHVQFKEDKISVEEIKEIFVEIFRDGIGREIDKVYPHK
jgi:hypothetical protein